MRQKSGIAIVATLVILVLVGLLVFGTFYTTQIEQFVTRNDSTSTQANYIAQAGLQKYKTALFQNFRWALGQPAANASACENPLYSGIDWDRNGPGSMQTFDGQGRMVFTDNIAGGQATITIRRDANDRNYMTITSVGRFAGAQSSVRAVFNLANAGLLRYAIVAGSGSGQRSINGSANIRGGVFIEGDQTDPTRRVFVGSGNMQVGNTYDLTGNSLLSTRVTPARANNLCSSFRVRWGTIGIGGSAGLGSANTQQNPNNNLVDIKIGDPSLVPSNPNLALAYTTSGNPQLITNQTCSPFCSQFVGRYDISDAESPRFPRLDGPGICGANQTWRQCIIADARNVVFSRGSPLPTLPAGASWSNATSCSAILNQTTISLDATTIDCRFNLNGRAAGGFYYSPNGTDGLLEVYGSVAMRGFNLQTIRGNNQARNILYRAYGYDQNGRAATILLQSFTSGQNRGGVLTLNGDVLPDGTAPFPQQALALMAEGNTADVSVDYARQGMTVAAMIYSGRRFVLSGSQATLAGMVLADSFCTNSNCNGGGSADIYYIDPGINLPGALAAIPGTRIAVFQILSYERF
ncbi:hypothetical protein [uncultured Meiothermus sp.]|jgi:hypothetical protein|uniref:hypothetical protein n=1 Tax=uncultured Meiothermus sp. TaxID=157471 RepID=UPI002628D33B|nr:hypothetical protein [uncultured Meiothermus sp.]